MGRKGKGQVGRVEFTRSVSQNALYIATDVAEANQRSRSTVIM